MSEYIGYRQTEELLSLYPEMKATLDNLCIELSDGFIDEGTLLSTKFMGNKILTDMPHTSSSPGDKVISTIEFKDRVLTKEKDNLIESINYLDRAFAMLSVSLLGLPEIWRKVIQCFYWEKRTWKVVAGYVDCSVETCRIMRSNAIDRVADMCKITPELYQECIKRLPPLYDNRSRN